MGWVGYFEDNRDQLQENLSRAEQAMASSAISAEDKLRLARRALADARYLFDEIAGHLDLATSPDLDLALEMQTQQVAAFEANRHLDRSRWALQAIENENLELQIKIEVLQTDVARLESVHGVAATRVAQLEVEAKLLDDLRLKYDLLVEEVNIVKSENAALKLEVVESQDPARWQNEMKKYLSLPAIRRNRPER